jgi:hypothetical protein
MGADAARDRQRWPAYGADLRSGVAQVKAYIQERRAYLRSELPKLRRREPAR